MLRDKTQSGKVIRVSNETYDKLARMGDLSDSFDSVVVRLIHDHVSRAAVAAAEEDSEK